MEAKITLEDFLSLYNFKYFISANIAHKDFYDADARYDTKTVRIYWDGVYGWGEFGVYDFGSAEDTKENIATLLNPKLLKRLVSIVEVDEDLDILNIYLEKEDTESNESDTKIGSD